MSLDPVLSDLSNEVARTHVLAQISAKQRKALRPSQFALPNKRMFPIHDAPHAQAALSLVGRALKAGSITPQEAAIVRRKASAALKRYGGSATK